MQYTTNYDSPIGFLTILAEDDALVGIWLKGQNNYGVGIANSCIPMPLHPILQQTVRWLDSYFNGTPKLCNDIKLSPKGTRFQQLVWSKLLQIPYGQVTTYNKIASLIADENHQKSRYCQAVGNAISKNPILIMIPCHRVIGSNGQLTGYAGGLHTKKWLLDFEQSHL